MKKIYKNCIKVYGDYYRSYNLDSIQYRRWFFSFGKSVLMKI